MVDIITGILGVSSAVLGASLTALYNKLSNREQIRAYVTSVELSSHILSRVDQVELPTDIAVKYRSFSPWLKLPNCELNESSNVLSIGSAQEALNYLQAFQTVLARAFEKINSLEQDISSVESINHFFEDDTLGGLFRGMCARQEMPVVTLPDTLPDCLVPYEEGSYEDGEKTHKGIYISTPTSNQFLHYITTNQKAALLDSIKAICHAVDGQSQKILDAIKDRLTTAKILAYDLEKWFEANLDLNSTIIVSLAISNLGKSPVLLSNYSSLSVKGMDGDQTVIPCISENFNTDTASEQATNTIVKSFATISKLLGVPLHIRSKVPLDRILVNAGEQEVVTFRSVLPICKLPKGKSIISYYKTNERRGIFKLSYLNSDSKEKDIEVQDIFFGSNLELAEKVANNMLQRTQ